MDNNTNTNTNVSGFSNVSDIKFDYTPAESFENLYGGVSSQPVSGNVVNNQGPSMVPNPGMNPSVNQGPSMTPNPAMGQNVNQGPSVTPNPTVGPNINQGPGVTPNPAMGQNISQGPSMTPNPSMGQNINQGPSMTLNSAMNPSVNQGPSMTTNPAMNPSVNQGLSMTQNPAMNTSIEQKVEMKPNPGTIIQPPVEDLSNMDIDAEKMQSIEEQLSKTSQYNPADFQQEKITISTDNEYEKNKSGLSFVIVLFIILALVIAFLPQITKLIK